MTKPTSLLIVAVLSTFVLLPYSELSYARGGGFVRGGVAAGGGLAAARAARDNADNAGERSSESPREATRPLRDARSSGDVSSSRDARSGRDARSTAGASSIGGAGTAATGSVSNTRSAAPAVRDASPEDMARYRAQFARDNASVADDDRWDRPLPVDPGYGVPVRGTAATAAVINTAIARDNALDYVETNTGTDYYTELPCDMQGNLERDGSMYYRCKEGWYKRAMRGEDMVFIRVDAPPGF